MSLMPDRAMDIQRRKKRAADAADSDMDTTAMKKKASDGGGIEDIAMSSGNPYAMAGGLAIKALKAKKKREREGKEEAIRKSTKQRKGMIKGVDKMVGISQSMKL